MNSDIDYCRELLRTNDYPTYLLSLFMPADGRAALWALGALAVTLRQIPATVSEPTLAYMRLAWWRDQVGLLEQGTLTKGQPVLSMLFHLAHPCESRDPSGSRIKSGMQDFYMDLTAFIDDQEKLIETPQTVFVSEHYQWLIQTVLGSHHEKYQRLEAVLADITQKYRGTKWERHPPFLGLKLWWANLSI